MPTKPAPAEKVEPAALSRGWRRCPACGPKGHYWNTETTAIKGKRALESFVVRVTVGPAIVDEPCQWHAKRVRER